MTLEELKELCEAAIAFQEEVGHVAEPNFNIIIPRIAYGRRTKVIGGLWGANMGHYPHRDADGKVKFWGTMVNLKVANVQKWIEKVEAEMKG